MLDFNTAKQRYSTKVANVITLFAVDGHAPGVIDLDAETFKALSDLQLIAYRSVDEHGDPYYRPANALAEMTPPYTRMMEEFKKVRDLIQQNPTVAARASVDFMGYLSQEIGYGLLASWESYLRRREKDPNTKPYYTQFD